MQNLLSKNNIPRFGQRVQIFIGEPVDISNIVKEYNSLSEEEQTKQG